MRSFLGRIARTLPGLLLLLLIRRGPDARAAEVALLPLEMTGGITASREAVEAAVAKGIVTGVEAAAPKGSVTGGQSVLTAQEAAAALAAAGRAATCATPACWGEIARTLGVRYLVRGGLDRRAGVFHARFALLRAADGLEAGRGEGACDDGDCSIAELGRTTARDLVRRELGPKASEGAPAGKPPALLSGAPVGEPDGAGAFAPAPAWRTVVPAAGIAVGLAAVGVGLVVLARDGTCIDDCTYRHRTARGAVPAIVAGGTAAVLGAVFVLRVPSAPDAAAVAKRGGGLPLTFGFGPRAFALQGRF